MNKKTEKKIRELIEEVTQLIRDKELQKEVLVFFAPLDFTIKNLVDAIWKKK